MELFRPLFSLEADPRTEENEDVKGDVVVLLAEGPEEPGRGAESDGGATLVARGVRPRRELD